MLIQVHSAKHADPGENPYILMNKGETVGFDFRVMPLMLLSFLRQVR